MYPHIQAGFPFFQLERFLKTLVVDLNCYVAVAEEFPNDPGDRVKSGGLMHDRRVTRVITPGTLIDENFIDPYANNYVMAIHLNNPDQEGVIPITSVEEDQPSEVLTESVPSDTPIGLAWLDISTGQFYTQSTTVSSLPSILSRVAPREIVIDEILESQKDHNLFSVLAEDKHLITFAAQGEHLPLSAWTPMLESEVPAQAAPTFTADEVAAGSLLLQYVRNRLLGMLSLRLQAPMRHENLAVMTVDKTTMRSLEIKETIRDGTFRGSLLHAIRRTVTKGGARLLNAWLGAPSTSLETIRARQDLVEAFIRDDDLRDEVVLLLRRCHDSQRLVQKFAFGRGDADDMIALASTIHATQDIVSLLKSHRNGSQEEAPSGAGDNGAPQCFESLLSRITLDEPSKLATRIGTSIDEEGLVQQHRNEDSEASELAALAEDVVAAEEEGKEANKKKTTAAAAAAARKRRPPSIRDHYFAAATDDNNLAFVMKPEASPGLRKLHAELAALLREKVTLAETLREQYDTPSLTLKWTPNLGHIVHVKGKDVRKISSTNTGATTATTTATTKKTKKKATTKVAKEMEETKEDEAAVEEKEEEEEEEDDDDQEESSPPVITTVSASRSTRALHLPAWTRLGQRIHRARFEIAAEERRLFSELRALVVRNLVKLRRNAAVLDELDVLAASFARLAAAESGGGGGGSGNGWVRPILDDSTSHSIIGGRHPTVEAGLRERGRTFTKNDCLVGSGSGAGSSNTDNTTPTTSTGTGTGTGTGKLWLITGPNMAGKSTYLRQNALITMLAQAGSWVPADHARLGVVDAIYSRVGSAAGDSLHTDQSTFMVEMLEAAQILRRATPRSLVVMDEVGRGTTPADGAAVAFAALSHLATVNRCRGLFATHFHVLADWAGERGMLVGGGDGSGGNGGGQQIDTYCTDVEEDGAGGFVYVHKLRKGVNRQSHALKVARLAGLPEAAITVAREILAKESVEQVDTDTKQG